MTSIDLSDPRILIVDDDPFIVDLASELLAAHDRDVLTATSGPEALAILANGSTVDLLLCDLNMPDMDGVELIRHLADLRFTGALALLSGEDPGILDAARRLAAAHDLRVVAALTKPLTFGSIGALLSRIAPGPAPRPARAAHPVSVEDLARGIAAGELIAHYQPRVRLADRAVTGVEALVRWQHPRLGLVYPGDFVPLAEEAGLMGPLTQAVLGVALGQAAEWRAAEWRAQGLDLRIGVNASITSLADVSFPDEIARLARAAGVPMASLIIEVTESQLLDRLSLTLDTLARLRLKGVGLAIDDFGTGFASFEQLHQIPFTELKVDRQFVHGAHADAKLHALLEASLALAARLDLLTVAEGVEIQADWDDLLALGAGEAQGYFIARPMPGERLAAWVSQW